MTVMIPEQSNAQYAGGTATCTVVALSPLIMVLIDGAETPCPASKGVNTAAGVLNQRRKVQLRNPLPPLLQDEEEA